MLVIKSIRLFHIILYMMVTSQVLFYLFAYNDALKHVQIKQFVELRKTVDLIIADRLKILYLCCLACSVILLFLNYRSGQKLHTVVMLAASLLLLGDIIIAIKGSIPINQILNNPPVAISETELKSLQFKWLNYMQYRGICMSTGIISILAGYIFSEYKIGAV